MDPYALTGMKSLRRRLKAIFCSLTHLAEAYPEKKTNYYFQLHIMSQEPALCFCCKKKFIIPCCFSDVLMSFSLVSIYLNYYPRFYLSRSMIDGLILLIAMVKK